MRILIVEDDYFTAEVMKEILSEFGEVELAVNGKEGIDKFDYSIKNNEKYDLIFLDIMMPEIDGLQTLKEIRQIEATNNISGLDGIKIIMVTALDDFENIKIAFKNQAEGYVVKPIEKAKIIKALNEHGFIN